MYALVRRCTYSRAVEAHLRDPWPKGPDMTSVPAAASSNVERVAPLGREVAKLRPHCGGDVVVVAVGRIAVGLAHALRCAHTCLSARGRAFCSLSPIGDYL